MKSLYNVDQIVKVSKHNGGGKTSYKYSPPTFITLFGKKFEISGEGYYYGAFSIDRKSIVENEYIFKGDDGGYYRLPYIRINFVDRSELEIPFKTIEDMERNFNYLKNDYPNLIEL